MTVTENFVTVIFPRPSIHRRTANMSTLRIESPTDHEVKKLRELRYEERTMFNGEETNPKQWSAIVEKFNGGLHVISDFHGGPLTQAFESGNDLPAKWHELKLTFGGSDLISKCGIEVSHEQGIRIRVPRIDGFSPSRIFLLVGCLVHDAAMTYVIEQSDHIDHFDSKYDRAYRFWHYESFAAECRRCEVKTAVCQIVQQIFFHDDRLPTHVRSKKLTWTHDLVEMYDSNNIVEMSDAYNIQRKTMAWFERLAKVPIYPASDIFFKKKDSASGKKRARDDETDDDNDDHLVRINGIWYVIGGYLPLEF